MRLNPRYFAGAETIRVVQEGNPVFSNSEALIGSFPHLQFQSQFVIGVKDHHIWYKWLGYDTEAVKGIRVTRVWRFTATMSHIAFAYGCGEIMFLVRYSPACIHYRSRTTSES